jgi:acyl-coenzyme A synthetase/AMP-(fatty) acid ligase
MSLQPVIGQHGLNDVLAWRPSGPVRVHTFLKHAQALAAQLPPGAWLLNMCEDRYHFAVGFIAGLLAQKISLQPSSQSPETLKRIAHDYPDVICLKDGPGDWGAMTCIEFPDLSESENAVLTEIPTLPRDQIAAILFTSGSTGTPQPHPRTFGQLEQSALSEAEGLAVLNLAPAIVGTVPAQHSFGFESTFLLALYGGCSFWSGKPFYPQDIVDALAAVPLPRMLVTTPFHLSALVGSGLRLPKIETILSATAPLNALLAMQAETYAAAPVHEIYGSTETSALATRRTTDGLIWTLLPGVALRQEGDATYAGEGHVPSRVALSDVVELSGVRQFLLLGRHADLVNIAGKRTSLAYLDVQVSEIEGVRDVAFFLPDAEANRIGRLTAFVVAPGIARTDLVAAMRQRLDAVFMPRPLIQLDALPRNSLGKLPRSQLQALYEEKRGHVRD